MTVSLMNPTPANVAYVEQRYEGACVQNEPAGPVKECGETTRGLTRDGRVTSLTCRTSASLRRRIA